MLPLVPALRAEAPAAPLPSQILTAKKVFISNGGGGVDNNIWSGDSSRAYNEFYAAVKAWGHYVLVGSPAEADLVLQIGNSFTVVKGRTGTAVSFEPWPEIRLAFIDPKSNIILWALDKRLELFEIGFQKSRDKNYSDSLNSLVDNLKALTAQPAATSNPK
jgi:hypothetical protein